MSPWLIFQHGLLSQGGASAQDPTQPDVPILELPGPAAGVQISRADPFHRWGKGQFLFTWGSDDWASFPVHSDWHPSCSLPRVLSENNRPLIFSAGSSAQTSVLVQSSSECLLPQILVQGSFPAGIVTQHSLFAWNKTVWVPQVDQIPTYSYCPMLHGLPFPSLLICFGNPACGWDPMLPGGRIYTAAPSLRLPNWIFRLCRHWLTHSVSFPESLQAPHFQYFLSAFFFSGSFSSLVFCKLITSTVQC